MADDDDRLAIEHGTVLGMPRRDFVELAADLGCRRISTNLATSPHLPSDHPPYSLRDAAARRELRAVLLDRGVGISLGEGLLVHPDTDVRDLDHDLDALAELGVPRINTVSFEPDLGRTIEQIGLLAEAAAGRGMETTLEASPGLTVADLPTAVHVVEQVGRPDVALLVDVMHVVRSGSSPADVARLPREMVGYVQLCDSPRTPAGPGYLAEATSERLVPGEGELPLRELLAALPRDVVVGLEIPQLTSARAGVGAAERIRPMLDAARLLLAAATTV